MKTKKPLYIGRYAPSPTGRLHLGNLRTALLAWLHARLHNGKFLLRMDDLDTPRLVKGCDVQILHDLEWMGLDWDDDVYYQSQQLEVYEAALSDLKSRRLIYPCFCSRKDIQQAASAPHGRPAIYPNTCRELDTRTIEEKRMSKTAAWRFNVSKCQSTICFHDGVQGDVSECLIEECGDFVVRRADKLFAYQLAVVVDDANQAITDVVRGADLLGSTARQITLLKTLYPSSSAPKYWHVALMNDTSGQRLSKRDGADSIELWQSKSPEHLLAHLAYSIGLIKNEQPLSLSELLDSISLESLFKAKELE